ncbi:hypothetical protein MTR67_032986 [Solanum verrucosum]|uniref:Uncharacterized protein n=1 Tax=Solanum verrucosum TaxID=315347 RepID=A0AAF0ZGH7_SOLVR|nr:hypothetical protein MTR67_032986 [Solanum verrucosum]
MMSLPENVWQATWKLLSEDILHEERILWTNPGSKDKWLILFKRVMSDPTCTYLDYFTGYLLSSTNIGTGVTLSSRQESSGIFSIELKSPNSHGLRFQVGAAVVIFKELGNQKQSDHSQWQLFPIHKLK